MGFSIRDYNFVRSRECVRFSECPLREVLLYSIHCVYIFANLPKIPETYPTNFNFNVNIWSKSGLLILAYIQPLIDCMID